MSDMKFWALVTDGGQIYHGIKAKVKSWYFGQGQTDMKSLSFQKNALLFGIHSPFYGIRQKNNKLFFLYPLSIWWKD